MMLIARMTLRNKAQCVLSASCYVCTQAQQTQLKFVCPYSLSVLSSVSMLRHFARGQ